VCGVCGVCCVCGVRHVQHVRLFLGVRRVHLYRVTDMIHIKQMNERGHERDIALYEMKQERECIGVHLGRAIGMPMIVSHMGALCYVHV